MKAVLIGHIVFAGAAVCAEAFPAASRWGRRSEEQSSTRARQECQHLIARAHSAAPLSRWGADHILWLAPRSSCLQPTLPTSAAAS